MKNKFNTSVCYAQHILCLLSILFFCSAFQKEKPHIRATYELIERITPGYGNQFILELIEPENELDVYEISGTNGKI